MGVLTPPAADARALAAVRRRRAEVFAWLAFQSARRGTARLTAAMMAHGTVAVIAAESCVALSEAAEEAFVAELVDAMWDAA